MNSQGSNSNESPPDWHWKLEVERRLIWLEIKVRDHLGKKTTDNPGRSPGWEPRDYLAAGAGIVMVMAALTEKTGWPTAIAGLVKLFGGE